MQLGKVAAAALAGGFVLGGTLAVIAGGPIWLGSGYAALALVLWPLPTLLGRPTRVPSHKAHARERGPGQPPRPAVTADPAAASSAPTVSRSAPAAPSPSDTSLPTATAPPTATTATAPDQTAAQPDGDRAGAAIASHPRVDPAWPAAPSGAAAGRSHRARPAVTANAPQKAAVKSASEQHAARPAAPERTRTEAAAHPRAATSTNHPIQTASAAIGYMTLTDTHATSDHAPPGASESIQARCLAYGLTLLTIARDTATTRTDGHERPALRWTLKQLADGHAQTLVVARLADLSDSAAGLAEVLRWLEQQQRTLIAIDLELNTSTNSGRHAAHAIVQVGGWEHERLSQRTRRGLDAARSRKAATGPAPSDVDELKQRIRRMRQEGMTLQAIADTLNQDGIPTLRGGAKWRPSSVQAAAGYRRPAPKRLDLPPGTQRK